jgi:uncharacterized protein
MTFTAHKDVMVAMRDGVELATDLWVPAASPAPTPDEPCELNLDLSVTSNVFLAGHRIRLEVSSSNFPRFDRNTNTGGIIADESAGQVAVAVNRVLHGPGYPSHLTLPVIRR